MKKLLNYSFLLVGLCSNPSFAREEVKGEIKKYVQSTRIGHIADEVGASVTDRIAQGTSFSAADNKARVPHVRARSSELERRLIEDTMKDELGGRPLKESVLYQIVHTPENTEKALPLKSFSPVPSSKELQDKSVQDLVRETDRYKPFSSEDYRNLGGRAGRDTLDVIVDGAVDVTWNALTGLGGWMYNSVFGKKK